MGTTGSESVETKDVVTKKSVKRTKSFSCEDCTRKEEAASPMLAREPVTSKVMVIVGTPTKSEDDTGNCFTSRLWFGLSGKLNEVGIVDSEWAYACPCRSEEDTTDAQEKRCHNDLIKYLRECGCEYTLLVGKSALNIFTNGKKKAITKDRGSVVEVDGIKGVPVYDYQDVLRDKELETTFKADLEFFQRLSTDTFKNPDHMTLNSVPETIKLNLIDIFKQCDCVSYDLETEGFDPQKGRVKMLGLAWRNTTTKNVSTCIIYPKETPFIVAPVYLWEWSDIKEVLMAAKRTCAHNSKFDDKWLQSRDIPMVCNMDTMLASYAENHMIPHSLKFLAKTLLHAPNYEEGIDHNDLSDEMRKKMEYYCQLDCYFTLLLREYYLKQELKYSDGVPGNYRKILAKVLMPGTRVLERIEARGVHVDSKEVVRVGGELISGRKLAHLRLTKLLPSPYMMDDTVNFDSPTQLRKLLYGKKSEGGFGFKPIYKERDHDDDDDPTTGKAALKKLAREGSEFCKVLLEYRDYSKGLSGFIEPWLEMLGETGNRLYPQYRLTLATGRSACYDPNLQQVSRNKMIRNLIKPTPGWLFVEVDYSQVELRVAAWIGRIHSMLKIYREGGDIHVNTAMALAKLGGHVWDDLDKAQKKEYRQKAKAVNFGFIYGMSADGFMEYADSSYDVVLTLPEAKAFRKVYFDLYPELQDWHDRSKRETIANKHVKTAFGFLRRLPNIDSVDSKLVSKAIRCGYNTPVQGSAFYLTLLSMIDLEEAFYPMPDKVNIIGQCHDAIFFEINPAIGEKNVNKILQYINDVMTHPRVSEFGLAIDVPLAVEAKVGKCWSDPDCKIFEPAS